MTEEFRSIGKTIVDDQICEVMSGPTHQLANWNRPSSDYYVDKKGDKIPVLLPFIHRPCFSFTIEEKNYSKTKWDATDVSSTVIATISMNKEPIYQFRCRDTSYAFAQCQLLATKIGEHSFDWFNIPSNFGRKIWYYNQPATIGSDFHLGEITVILDKTATNREHFIFNEPWRSEPLDDEPSDRERIDILETTNVWWFRE